MKTFLCKGSSSWIIVAIALPLLLLVGTKGSNAALKIYNSQVPSGLNDNTATRNEWLSDIAITSPAYTVDFESGFTDNQNISSTTGLFPAGLVITNADGSALVTSGTGSIGGSNPIGTYALKQIESSVNALILDFTLFPVSYVAFQDIDNTRINGIVTFFGGDTSTFAVTDGTGGSGDSAEFIGFYQNNMPRIIKLELYASGSQGWGIDNIQYGQVPIPAAAWLLGSGLIGLVAVRRRLRKN